MKENKAKDETEENDAAMEKDAALPDDDDGEITQKSKKKRKL